MRNVNFVLFIAVLVPVVLAGQDRIELGYQTTGRGIVWYRPGLPTYLPQWRFSRDTNKVMWVDTLTAIRYDFDYLNDVWRAKGTFAGALPPLPVQTSGAATIDNRSGYWIRDTSNLLHKYDSTANAWTPWGDWFYLSSVPTNINAGASNGAAKYTRSLWQNSGTFEVRYWDGDSWEPFGSTADGSETIVTAGTGISVTGTGTSGTPYVVTNTGDLSTTNEIQTYAHSGTTSYTNTLSLAGGAFTIQSGTGITVAHTAGTVTISGTPGGGGGGGIYGDGTAGSGNDDLPPGGSTVGIPGQSQPLTFALGTAASQVWTAIAVTTPYCSDDAISKYFVGKSPFDSLEIYNYDCGAVIKNTGGELTLETSEIMYLFADSIAAQNLPTKTILPYVVGQGNGNILQKIAGTASGQVLKWNTSGSGYWELGASSSGPGGSGTANRFAYWTNSSTLAADDDAAFDGANVGFGTTTLTGRVNAHGGTSFTPFVLNGYATSQTGGVVYSQLSDLRTAGETFLAFNQVATLTSIPAGVRRFGSAHSTRPGEFNVVTIGSDPVTIGTNNTTRLTVTGAGVVYSQLQIGAGFSSPTNINSTLQTGGSFGGTVTQTTGNLTLNATHYRCRYTLNGTVSWTLPDPTTCTGREYIIHHFGSSGQIGLNYNVISSTGTTFNAVPARNWAYIYSDGSNWYGYRLTSS